VKTKKQDKPMPLFERIVTSVIWVAVVLVLIYLFVIAFEKVRELYATIGYELFLQSLYLVILIVAMVSIVLTTFFIAWAVYLLITRDTL
jgi:hypothetical protein